jgi:hypothetical protein
MHHKTKDIMSYSLTDKTHRPPLLVKHHLKIWPKLKASWNPKSKQQTLRYNPYPHGNPTSGAKKDHSLNPLDQKNSKDV